MSFRLSSGFLNFFKNFLSLFSSPAQLPLRQYRFSGKNMAASLSGECYSIIRFLLLQASFLLFQSFRHYFCFTPTSGIFRFLLLQAFCSSCSWLFAAPGSQIIPRELRIVSGQNKMHQGIFQYVQIAEALHQAQHQTQHRVSEADDRQPGNQVN